MKRTIVSLALAMLAAPSLAQPSGASSAPEQKFQIDAGYFNLKAQTVLEYNAPGGRSGEVNFEQDLGQADNVNTFWLDSTWRVGRRHQLKLGYTQLSRDRGGKTLERDFVWGGVTYNAGLSATSSSSSSILGGYYRFSAFRNDRFEIGPSIGIGYLWLSAGIKATGTVGSQTRSLDQSKSMGAITGALGGFTTVRPVKNLALHADYLYIKVTPKNETASVTDWRIASDFFFSSHVGVGAQYKYNKYTQAVGSSSVNLGGKLIFKGIQAFLTFRF